MKYACIDTRRENYPFRVMHTTPGPSISGFRAVKSGRTPDRMRRTATQPLMLLRSVHTQYKVAYGPPRMTADIAFDALTMA